MKLKTMVIGLGPEYNYPKNFSLWGSQNTRYASNHGASFISRAISKQFDADFVDDFSNIDLLNEKYDTCFIAFATHITTWRDVSEYVDVVVKLNMKVVALSLGVQDYYSKNKGPFVFHPSLKRLLDVVSEKSNYIGVRGSETANLMYKNGYTNVLPIGCPTMYWNLNDTLTITKKPKSKNPALVYQKTFAKEGFKLLKNVPIIGQDFLDEAIFTNSLTHDLQLTNKEIDAYKTYGNYKEVQKYIKNQGVFHFTFDEWFRYLSGRDFAFGPRLHGCIASLVQGVPAVMIARDLRVKEIAEFYDLPYYTYENVQGRTMQDIYDEADFEKFNTTYKKRYRNYLDIVKLNELSHNLEQIEKPSEFEYGATDIARSLAIIGRDIQDIKIDLEEVKKYEDTVNKMKPIIKKLVKIKKYFT